MRALGPGSVSSFLKVILDVVRWVLIISIGAVSVAILAALLLSFNPDLLGGAIDLADLHIKGAWLGPIFAGVLLAADLYLGLSMVIVGRLRRIFQTLIVGDPFHPDNVRRLRIISGALALQEVGGYVFAAFLRGLSRLVGLDHASDIDISSLRMGGEVHLTAWFAVMVILVLAEVFREGARLRGEAELTI